MKRLFDFIVSLIGLLCSSPLLVPAAILVWLHDFHSPFYIAPRLGKNKRIFRMVKLRSMVVNADKSGVHLTSNRDSRLTPVGSFIREFKLDELPQLWNVLIGDMSFVGPRPNLEKTTDLYTNVEEKLLTVIPGITDFSSIVFFDEGEILSDSADPVLKHNQLVRPWKSRLGLFYIEHQTFILDIKLILITIMAIFSQQAALKRVHGILEKLGADEQLLNVVLRKNPLSPYPPPGTDRVVESCKPVIKP